MATKIQVMNSAGLTSAERKGARVETRHGVPVGKQEVTVHTVKLADGTSKGSFVDFTDGLIEWGEFVKALHN